MPRLNVNSIFKRSGIVLGCLILWAIYVPAQTGSITGKITDSTGTVVVGSEIRVVCPVSAQTSRSRAVTVVSNLEGEYTIQGLPVGVCEVEVKAQGFATLQEKVVVVSSSPTRLDLQLNIPEVCEGSTGQKIELTEEDRAEIINQVLRMTLQGRQSAVEGILLSTQNIKAEWARALPGDNITALSYREIMRKARPGKTLFYYSFTDFEVQGGCVAVSLLRAGITLEGDFIEECTLCGGVWTYAFRKENGKWEGKFFGGWIS